jgi:DNA replication initiation complex subunit (GINS family)
LLDAVEMAIDSNTEELIDVKELLHKIDKVHTDTREDLKKRYHKVIMDRIANVKERGVTTGK